jgi:8-amino-3,8-dideoxy-alpha-D-manno-octulosonate transaminase
MPGYEVFGDEERQAINELFEANGGILFAHGFDALRKGIYKVREFEAAAARKFAVAHAQAVSSGTAALRVALAALGVGRGDEVIIPAFTFVATAEAVIQSGATLVVVDIDESLNIDPEALAAAITPATRAIIAVHMLGAAADMDAIAATAQRHGLLIIEDAAQAVGGGWWGRSLCTFLSSAAWWSPTTIRPSPARAPTTITATSIRRRSGVERRVRSARASTTG